MHSTSPLVSWLRPSVWAFALLASGAVTAQSFPTLYAITAEMPAPPTLPDAVAYRLNNAGQAAGSGVYRQGTVTRLVFINGWPRLVTTAVERSMAVSWTNGQFALLKPLATNSATSIGDINDSGWVVGDSFKSSTAAKGYATVWRNGVVTDLGAGLGSVAQRINSQGWVLGVRPLTTYSSQPFLWRNNRVENLGLPPGAPQNSTNCVGLTDAGTVACRTLISEGLDGQNWHSHLWSNGAFQELTYPGATGVLVNAVSRNGIIAGTMTLAGDVSTPSTLNMPDRPFLWRDGVFTFLPRVTAGFYANILAVTDQGTVLADLNSATGSRQEIWTATGSVTVLPTGLRVNSGDAVVRVHDLNDQGQLLAAVKKGTAAERQVLLTPLLP